MSLLIAVLIVLIALVAWIAWVALTPPGWVPTDEGQRKAELKRMGVKRSPPAP